METQLENMSRNWKEGVSYQQDQNIISKYEPGNEPCKTKSKN